MVKDKKNDVNKPKTKKILNTLPLFAAFSSMDEITEILPNGEMNSKNDVNPRIPNDTPNKPQHTL